jgi:hypothetical protein
MTGGAAAQQIDTGCATRPSTSAITGTYTKPTLATVEDQFKFGSAALAAVSRGHRGADTVTRRPAPELEYRRRCARRKAMAPGKAVEELEAGTVERNRTPVPEATRRPAPELEYRRRCARRKAMAPGKAVEELEVGTVERTERLFLCTALAPMHESAS